MVPDKKNKDDYDANDNSASHINDHINNHNNNSNHNNNNNNHNNNPDDDKNMHSNNHIADNLDSRGDHSRDDNRDEHGNIKDKKTLLIAEDEPSIMELLKIIFSDKYELALAEDGKKVFDLVSKRKPDLILLDVMMPGINGYEVCQRLKNDPKTKDIKIAILSAKGQEQDIVKGLELGADYYITKPFDPENLVSKIDEIIKG